MKVGSRGSSPSVRRRIRTAWLSAPSVTTTSLQTMSRISPLDTASFRRSTNSTSKSKQRGISGSSLPSRTSVLRAGDRTWPENR